MIPKEIYQAVKKLFKQQHWNGKKIIAAVSGGADSMALCIILKHLDVPFVIAHCNYQLRNEDSNDDEIFVRTWGKENNIPVYVQKFNTQALLEQGGNLQDVCRNLRYEWFERLRKELEYDVIATAHHQQDVVETVLMNLLKGTGLAGLHGIATDHQFIIRPLLSFTKDSLINMLNEFNVSWREDSSNAKDDYVRNKIRHHLIPVINKIQPNGIKNIFNTSRYIQEAEAYISHKQEFDIIKLLEHRNNDIYIPIRKLVKIPGYKSLMYSICKRYCFSSGQIEDCLLLLEAHTGKFVSNQTFKMIKNRDFLIITKNDSEKSTHILIEIARQLNNLKFGKYCMLLEACDVKHFSEVNNNVCLLNSSKLVFPLTLRPLKEGDYFYPIGMGGKKKKVSKLLKDLKMPIHEKQQVWILQNGDEKIIWVVGLRADERFKVQDTNQEILKLECVPN